MNKDTVDSGKNTNTVRYDVRVSPDFMPRLPYKEQNVGTISTAFADQQAPDVMPPIAVNFMGSGQQERSTDMATRTSADINIRILQTLEELVTELKKRDSVVGEQNFTTAWALDQPPVTQATQETGGKVLTTTGNGNGSPQFSHTIDNSVFYFTDSFNKAVPPPIIPKDTVAGFNEIGTVKLSNLRGIRDERHWPDTTQIDFNKHNNVLGNNHVAESGSSFQQSVITLPKQTGSMYQILMGSFANVSATKRDKIKKQTAKHDTVDETAAPVADVMYTTQVTPQARTEPPTLNDAGTVRAQTVIQASDRQIQNPFAGTNIPLRNITDKLGNIIAVEPQYRATSVNNAFGQLTTMDAAEESQRDGQISIEGKYYIGEMKRNSHGQFEPVPVGASVLLQDNTGATLLQPTENSRGNALTSNTEVLISAERPNVFINLPTRSTGMQRNIDKPEFINQETLLNLINQQDAVASGPPGNTDKEQTFTESLTLYSDPQTVMCNEGEQFACNAVGSYKDIPGMVWWCFSHCKNGVCPREKCKCSCEISGVIVKSSAIPRESSKPRVKKVINLTLNGSKESLVRVGEGFSSSTEKILEPRLNEASPMMPKTLNVNKTVVDSQKGSATGRLRPGARCRGINAFAGMAGMDDWCTTMCRRDVCPAEICSC